MVEEDLIRHFKKKVGKQVICLLHVWRLDGLKSWKEKKSKAQRFFMLDLQFLKDHLNEAT